MLEVIGLTFLGVVVFLITIFVLTVVLDAVLIITEEITSDKIMEALKNLTAYFLLFFLCYHIGSFVFNIF